MTELERLYQEVILEHNRHPRGWGAPEGADRRAARDNPFCGDRVSVWVRSSDGMVGFEAKACAIVKASASMMTEAVRGLALPEIANLFENLQKLLRGESSFGLGELAALAGVAAFPVRIACATLPWLALTEAMR